MDGFTQGRHYANNSPGSCWPYLQIFTFVLKQMVGTTISSRPNTANPVFSIALGLANPNPNSLSGLGLVFDIHCTGVSVTMDQ